MTRLVLIHGAATGPSLWAAVSPLLRDLGYEVDVLERPRTGDLGRELAWLAPRVEGAWVVGVSGGATLGLALASSPVRLAGAILHEPAVGALLPGLLAPMRAAFLAGGLAEFARVLYGPAWTPAHAEGQDEDTVAAELAMFGAFEPEPVAEGQGPIIVTYGAESPPVRREAAGLLQRHRGHRIVALAGCAHCAPVESPAPFVAGVTGLLRAES